MNDKPNKPDPPQNDDDGRPLAHSTKCRLARWLVGIAYSDDQYAGTSFTRAFINRLDRQIDAAAKKAAYNLALVRNEAQNLNENSE